MTLLNEGYLSESELHDLDFKSLGKNVKIARNSTVIGMRNISLGDNIRIDSYTTIVASERGAFLNLGRNIHIGAYCYLGCAQGIILEDFAGLSQGVRIYSQTDDYTGVYMTNPTVPSAYTGASGGTVCLRRHVIIGSGTVVLPAVTIAEGTAVGAQSLVSKNLEAWGVYFGCPVKRLKSRSKQLLSLENKYRHDDLTI